MKINPIVDAINSAVMPDVINASMVNVGCEDRDLSQDNTDGSLRVCINKKASPPSYPSLVRAETVTYPSLKNANPSPNNAKKDKNPSKSSPGAASYGFLIYQDVKGENRRLIESRAAQKITALMSGKYAYCASVAAWHSFTGVSWQVIDRAAVDAFITGLVFEGTNPIGFRQTYLTGIISILTRGNRLPLPKQDTKKIPFLNGLYDVETQDLLATTPDNAKTWCIPHKHTQKSTCDFFIEWLRAGLSGDDELIALIRAFINACIIGRADLQKFLILLGPGGTGKSTLIRLLYAILGEQNCVATDLKNLEQNRFESVKLYGKRLATITDAGKYTGSADVLKAITGQDPLRREEKHKQSTGSFTFDGMVLIATNTHIGFSDCTSGLERRRLVVKFGKRLSDEEKTAFKLAGGEVRLHSEIPAIINWALKMSHDEVTRLFNHPPEKAAAAMLDALTYQNPVAEWICNNLIGEPGSRTLIGVRKESRPSGGGSSIFEDAGTKLYPNYLKWCGENKREALSLRKFREAAVDMLETLGISVTESKRVDGMGINGVRIRQEYEPVTDIRHSVTEKCRI